MPIMRSDFSLDVRDEFRAERHEEAGDAYHLRAGRADTPTAAATPPTGRAQDSLLMPSSGRKAIGFTLASSLRQNLFSFMPALIPDTRQRRIIRALLENVSQPMSSMAIHRETVRSLPKLSIVTVYRVLRAFEAEGLVNAVVIPGARSHYELARGHHHHFYCRACHRVLDIPCNGHPNPPRIGAGFKVEEEQVVLVGLCPNCARPA
jgi:Fur family ferric uptake transcriptional regulator